MWKLNKTLMNNQKVKEEIKKYLETNEDENITPKLTRCSKWKIRGKFIAVNTYIKKKKDN